jgi:N-acetylneuraminic acid mutarotase
MMNNPHGSGVKTVFLVGLAAVTTSLLMVFASAPALSLQTQTTATNIQPTIQATCVVPYLVEGVWMDRADRMPTPRSETAAAVIGGTIYVPGGFGGPAAMEAFIPVRQSWVTLAPMPEGRNHLMTAAHGGYVYVFGGGRENTFEATDTAWRYDPVSDTWSVLSNMPEPRFAGAAVALGDYLYVVGGEGGTQALLRYDPAADGWEAFAELQQPREHLAAAVLEGKIYALAGRWEGEIYNTVEVYDPAAGEWTFSDPMQEARSGFGAAVIGEHIFVAGGEVFGEETRALRSVEVYHPTLHEWTYIPELPYAVHGNPVASMDNTLYVLGGSDRAAAIENVGRVLWYRIPSDGDTTTSGDDNHDDHK